MQIQIKMILIKNWWIIKNLTFTLIMYTLLLTMCYTMISLSSINNVLYNDSLKDFIKSFLNSIQKHSVEDAKGKEAESEIDTNKFKQIVKTILIIFWRLVSNNTVFINHFNIFSKRKMKNQNNFQNLSLENWSLNIMTLKILSTLYMYMEGLMNQLLCPFFKGYLN